MNKYILLPSILVVGNINAQKADIPNSPKKPNILCVVCEDISPMIGCFGDKVSVTPNLDNFSKKCNSLHKHVLKHRCKFAQ